MALTRNDISFLSTAVVTAAEQITPRMLRACQDALGKLQKELEHREMKEGIRRAQREDEYFEAGGGTVSVRSVREAPPVL